MPLRRIRPGGTRGTVFRDVARQRWKDAATLLDGLCFDSAIYLAGYAVECHLKFTVCKRKTVIYLPVEFEIHEWDPLVDAAGLANAIKGDAGVAAIYSALAEEWGPELRYRTRTFSPMEAARLYKAMEKLYLFLTEIVR